MEKRIVQKCDPSPRFYAAKDDDIDAAHTSFELDELHKNEDLRGAIKDQYRYVAELVLRAYSAREQLGNNSREFLDVRDHVKRLVSRDAPFTMMMRDSFGSISWVREPFD